MSDIGETDPAAANLNFLHISIQYGPVLGVSILCVCGEGLLKLLFYHSCPLTSLLEKIFAVRACPLMSQSALAPVR